MDGALTLNYQPQTQIDMTPQAKNCLDLYRGGNPTTIKQLLMVQKPSVVNELKNHFGEQNLDKLAVRLSIGK